MRTPHPTIALPAILACLAIPAPVAHAQDNVIATMDVDGGNAFVDNARQPASGRDIRIVDGNLVRTGADTSALVEIIPEGSVQLNENSAKLITRSEEHTSEIQSLMRRSYAVFCLKNKYRQHNTKQ